MLLVLRRVEVRVLPPLLLLPPPSDTPKGLPCRPSLLLLPLPGAAAAAVRVDGRTLKVAPPTSSFTTAMLFSVSVPVLSLQHSTAQHSNSSRCV